MKKYNEGIIPTIVGPTDFVANGNRKRLSLPVGTLFASKIQKKDSSEKTFLPHHASILRSRKRGASDCNEPLMNDPSCFSSANLPVERHAFASPSRIIGSAAKPTSCSSPSVTFGFDVSPCPDSLVLSPTSNELSNFSHLTIRTSGSSFATYSSGRKKNLTDTPTTPSSAQRMHFRQSPRHVPLEIIAANHSQLNILPRSPERNTMDGVDLPIFGSPQAVQPRSPVQKSPRFLIPRCTKNIYGEKSFEMSSTKMHQCKRSPSRKAIHPPISFLTLNNRSPSTRSIHKAGSTSRSLLNVSSEEDSLDDFEYIEDDASNGSLSDSCDEDAWFFLSSPTKNNIPATGTNVTPCPDGPNQKKPRSPNEESNGTCTPGTLKPRGAETNLFPIDSGASMLPRGGSSALKSTRYTSSSSLFGMDAICENSMSTSNLPELLNRNISGPANEGSLGSTCPNPALSLPRNDSEISLGLGLENVPVCCDRRDLITPPIINTLQLQPPSMKQARDRHNAQKIVIGVPFSSSY